MKRVFHILALVLLPLLAGCGAAPVTPTKAEMLKKVAGKTGKGELRSTLGEPQEVLPDFTASETATWVYKASDGEVHFTVYGDNFEIPKAPKKE